MLVLAFDTSSPITTVAVTREGEVVAEDDRAEEGKHGELLLPRIERLLRQAGATLGQVGLIAVGVGPGSFTGLRVGLSTAKGLAFAGAIPVRAVDSLAALALTALAGRDGLALTVLDAFKGEVYGAGYRVEAGGAVVCACEAFHATPQAAAERLSATVERVAARDERSVVLCGDGAQRYREVLEARLAAYSVAKDRAPRARHVAALGMRLMKELGPSDPVMLEPTYVRGSDAKLPEQPLS